MSDYVRNKEVLYPFDDNILERYDFDFGDEWRLELEIIKRAPRDLAPRFHVKYMTDCIKGHYYLAYNLYNTYGEESREFGRSRFLAPTEQEKYKRIFEKVISGVDVSKLKYVDYCYYNGCDCPDFYNSSDNDDFNKEI